MDLYGCAGRKERRRFAQNISIYYLMRYSLSHRPLFIYYLPLAK